MGEAAVNIIVMRPALAFPLVLALAVVADAPAGLATVPGARPIAVRPAVGGQGSTFSVAFRSLGTGDEPFSDGDELIIDGPEDTACSGRIVGDSIAPFRDGAARFSFGPRPARPRYNANAHAYRPVSRWCPGLYTGRIDREDRSPSRRYLSFSFRVLRTTGSAPGRVLPYGGDDVERLPPQNPPWLRVRQLPGPDRAVRIDLRIGGRGEQRFFLQLVPPCGYNGGQPTYADGAFRAGAARLLIGGRGPRVVGRNVRRVSNARPLCRGRWMGSVFARTFRFTVR